MNIHAIRDDAEEVANGIVAPALYSGMSEEKYHAIEACSSSQLRKMRRSAAHCKAYREEDDSSDSMDLGSAVHLAILEPERYEEEVAIAGDCETKFKSGKKGGQPCGASGKYLRNGQWYCGRHDPGDDEGEAFDGYVVSESAELVASAIKGHPTAAALLSSGVSEVVALWKEECLCKARIDNWRDDLSTIVDLKTTRDASKDEFQRTIWHRGYFQQLAFYGRGLRALGKEVESYVIVAAETSPPYAVAVYELDITTVNAGRRLNDDLLPEFAACHKESVWPGYSEDLQEIGLPHWALKKL